MSPKAVWILSVVLVVLAGIFVAAYCLVGYMLIFYLMFAAAALIGPVLFLVGARKLYVRLHKLLRCKAEAEGRVVDYILSPWKYARRHSSLHGGCKYYLRWFPVVEYEVDGQRFRQKNKTAFLTEENERPAERTVLLRYDPKRPELSYMTDGPNEFSPVDWLASALFLFVGGLFTPLSILSVLFFVSWMTGGPQIQFL